MGIMLPAAALQGQEEQGLHTDTQALLSFKQIMEQDPLGILSSWNTYQVSNSCLWHGITCSNARVVSLDLTDGGLVAPLPTSALAPLDKLQQILLGGNRFYGYGTQQAVAAACNTLGRLDLSSNNLTGTFTTLFLQDCKTLTYLNVSRNLLSGPFPPHMLGAGSSIEWLDLSRNNFSGGVPSDLFSTCGSLLLLDLSHNSLGGPVPIGLGACPSLQSLDLSHNLLNSSLPPDLFSKQATTPNLSSINLSANQLSGSLPAFGACPNLVSLDVSDNLLAGPVSPSIALCANLLSLNLSFNNFESDLPASLTSATGLQRLYLSNNNFTGSIPSAFGSSFQQLQELDLSSNLLVGTIPASFANCTSLSYLDLSSNHLSGSFPSDVVISMPALQTLSMSFNNLTGPLPASLSNLTYLSSVDLSANFLSGSVLGTLCGPVLKRLVLADNVLTGNVPSGLGNCSTLVELDLSFNRLEGPLPASVPALPYLEDLMMWGNALVGELPGTLCQPGGGSHLRKLVLNMNGFTGGLPATLANCVRLEWLSLSSNALTGSIPPEIGAMPRIAMLQLANNSLTGGIPPSLGNCSMLIWLDLNNNQLQGTIPPELAKQAGRVTRGSLVGTSFAYLKNVQGAGCKGLGGLLEFAGIRPEHFLDLPFVRECNFTRLYFGSDPYYFDTGGTLQYLDLAYNQLEGGIPIEFGTLQYLLVLSLSHNRLSGNIPPVLSNLVRMTILYLDHNNLTGPIPSSLTTLGLLNQLDLSYNNLCGSIPDTGTLSTFPASVYGGNPGLCGGPLVPCSGLGPSSGTPSDGSASSSSSSGSEWSGVAIGLSALGTFVFIMACVCGLAACVMANHHRMRQHMRDHYMDNLPSSGSGSWNISAVSEPLSINVATFEKPLRKLTFAHLLEATNGFSPDTVIGRGGFGDVYKATLEDGTAVAIKKLIPLVGQGDREFMAEMETIGKIKHRNLVPLLGYCKVGEERLLVYEYMEGGSLDKRLHGGSVTEDGEVRLSWEMRKRIALGTARGLCFLHHSCIPHIIHRDLKSSNVLLDDALEARVSDFGMARLVNASETHLSVSSVVGTPGYVPPEYCHSFRCTTKGDVYSFGVVLLELITGRRPTWSTSSVSINRREAATSTTSGETTTTSSEDVASPPLAGAAVAARAEDEVGVDLVGWVRRHVKEGRQAEVLDEVAMTSDTTKLATPLWHQASQTNNEKEMLRYLDIACWCVEERPWKRPNMLQVMALLRELHRDQDLDPLD